MGDDENFALTPEDRIKSEHWLGKIEEWVMQGMTHEAVAPLLGFLPDEFLAEVRRNRQLKLALLRGRARGERDAAKYLRRMMSDPNSKGHAEAVRFFLRTTSWSPRPVARVEPSTDSGEDDFSREFTQDELMAALRGQPISERGE